MMMHCDYDDALCTVSTIQYPKLSFWVSHSCTRSSYFSICSFTYTKTMFHKLHTRCKCATCDINGLKKDKKKAVPGSCPKQYRCAAEVEVQQVPPLQAAWLQKMQILLEQAKVRGYRDPETGVHHEAVCWHWQGHQNWGNSEREAKQEDQESSGEAFGMSNFLSVWQVLYPCDLSKKILYIVLRGA